MIRKVFGKGLLTPVAMWLLLWGASCLEDWSPGSWWDAGTRKVLSMSSKQAGMCMGRGTTGHMDGA